MTTLQLNEQAVRDQAVDDYVDNLQREMARSNERLVVDSRLGWYFFPKAFKVHLIVDPSVAARRALSRPSDAVESYTSAEEARRGLSKRSDRENSRFLAMRGVDQHRLRNYDMVCDTSRAPLDAVVDLILDAADGSLAQPILRDSPPLLLLDPVRIYPAEDIRVLRDLWDSDFVDSVRRSGVRGLPPIEVGCALRSFYSIKGSRWLSATVQSGFELVPARLVGERDETVAGGWSADQYFENEVSSTKIYDWEAAHRIRLPLPEHVLQGIRPTAR